jgi:diguanylate cyclase (GGDEF)-like protein
MPGLLGAPELLRVFNAWRRTIRFDPLLSLLPIPNLQPLCKEFNDALTGEDDGRLVDVCDDLVRQHLEAQTVTRLVTLLAETFADEVGTTSGAVSRSLVSTFGHVCGLMMTTMVNDMALLATRDALTGLENRRAWDQALVSFLSEERKVVVCMIDLDGLKAVNDAHGHPAGDEYLRQFAKSLLNSTPPNGRAYRFGGDEYAMLLPDAETRDLEQVMTELHTREGIAPFSYGIAGTEDQFIGGDELTELADSRMYEMKKERKRQSEATAGDGEGISDMSGGDANANAE